MVERIIKANGIDICAEAFGDPSHPALLLIMGLGAQMISWEDAFCTTLATKGFYVVRFDNRDVGRSAKFDPMGVPNVLAMMNELSSGRFPKAPYLLSDMARDAVGVMDTLGIAKAHVVGASMGGMIGQTVAVEHAGRVRSLVSIMSSTGDRRLSQATPEAAAALFTPAPFDRDGYIRHHMAVASVLRGPHFPEETAFDQARAARIYDRGIHHAGTARQFAAVLASGDRTEKLKAVAAPTLVIHGDADPLVRIDAGKATAAAIPSARLEVIANMGHTLPRSLWPRLIDSIAGHAGAH